MAATVDLGVTAQSEGETSNAAEPPRPLPQDPKLRELIGDTHCVDWVLPLEFAIGGCAPLDFSILLWLAGSPLGGAIQVYLLTNNPGFVLRRVQAIARALGMKVHIAHAPAQVRELMAGDVVMVLIAFGDKAVAVARQHALVASESDNPNMGTCLAICDEAPAMLPVTPRNVVRVRPGDHYRPDIASTVSPTRATANELFQTLAGAEWRDLPNPVISRRVPPNEQDFASLTCQRVAALMATVDINLSPSDAIAAALPVTSALLAHLDVITATDSLPPVLASFAECLFAAVRIRSDDAEEDATREFHRREARKITKCSAATCTTRLAALVEHRLVQKLPSKQRDPASGRHAATYAFVEGVQPPFGSVNPYANLLQ